MPESADDPTTDTWLDLTYPIREGVPAWPGQPPVEVNTLQSIGCVGEAKISQIVCSVHTGTHVDGPMHFIEGDAGVLAMPAELMSGPARVCRIDDAEPHISAESLIAYEERTRPLQTGDRLIVRTRNSGRDWSSEPFDPDYAAVTPDAAKLLVDRGVAAVGCDYLSVAPFDDPATTHRILLHARVWVVEGLDLRQVAEGEGAWLVAPLAIAGADAAPARSLYRPRT